MKEEMQMISGVKQRGATDEKIVCWQAYGTQGKRKINNYDFLALLLNMFMFCSSWISLC